MKFRILIRTESGREWEEEYDKNITDPTVWAEETIDMFNRTLRPHEESRILLDVKITDDNNNKYHRWIKKTDGMSTKFRGEIVDIVYCERCGITGKRYGLANGVTIDSKFRKKAYIECDTAKEAMKER